MMKINNKVLSIPPFISTSWTYVQSLHLKNSCLIVSLLSGEIIEIPNLSEETLQLIFSTHATYLENEEEFITPADVNLLHGISDNKDLSDMSVKFGIGSMDGIHGNPLSHNPTQKDAPLIPEQVLQKISLIAKIIAPEEVFAESSMDPNCNCLHCQITKTLHPTQDIEIKDETVDESELQFQQWSIEQAGDQLFTVINKLDNLEKYSVYLGKPIGCTCGQKNCEHIVAVLKS